MIIRKTDDNNDWRFGKGIADYAKDDQAIRQNIKERVLSWVNDCFFALQEGVDWKNRFGPGQQAALQEELRTVILQSDGVVAVNTLSAVFDGPTRSFTVQYEATTIFSQDFQQTLDQISGTGG